MADKEPVAKGNLATSTLMSPSFLHTKPRVHPVQPESLQLGLPRWPGTGGHYYLLLLGTTEDMHDFSAQVSSQAALSVQPEM